MKWSAMTTALLLSLVGAAMWIGYGVGLDEPKAPNLQLQWALVLLILVCLCALSGLLVHGRVDGILIDERNRLSLSRVQWVAWFVVLVSAYFVGTVLNVKGGYGSPFPVMQAELFGLIGLSSGSAVLSTLIVDSKRTGTTLPDTPAEPPLAGQPGKAGNVGKVDVRAVPAEASWKDVYCGEEVSNRAVVDVSRLQQVVTTLLLLCVYVGFLWRDLDTAAFTGHFAQMPAVDGNFLGLLGISHAGYLLYKAAP